MDKIQTLQILSLQISQQLTNKNIIRFLQGLELCLSSIPSVIMLQLSSQPANTIREMSVGNNFSIFVNNVLHIKIGESIIRTMIQVVCGSYNRLQRDVLIEWILRMADTMDIQITAFDLLQQETQKQKDFNRFIQEATEQVRNLTASL